MEPAPQLSAAPRGMAAPPLPPSGRSHPHRHQYKVGRRFRPPPDDDSFINPCVKYSLFFFNLLFWFVGGGMVGIGAWSTVEEFNEQRYPKVQTIFDVIFNLSLAFMIVGGIIFIISFAGCLGALRENSCLLKFYSLVLLLLFLGELVLSTLAFVFPKYFSNAIKEGLSKDPITKYRDDTNLQNLIDVLQKQFQCCGISDKGYHDWGQNIYFNCTTKNPSPERCAVPYSCCRNPTNIENGLINVMCGYYVQNISSAIEVNKHIHTKGCIEAIQEHILMNLNLVAGICLVTALVQLFAMFLARTLQGQIAAQRARWLYS